MALKVWINAFIPQTVAGYTKVIPTGTHMGKTAVPLPGLARLNPLNLFKNWDTGYLTDQRSFNDAPGASVRMRSLAELDVSLPVRVTRTLHESSGTTGVDMATGRQLGFGVADMSRCSFFPVVEVPPVSHSRPYLTFPLGIPFTIDTPVSGVPTYKLRVLGQASDPLVSAAADIDYDGSFEITYDPAANRCLVAFNGLIDAFPAFECYAQKDGVTKCLFTAPPPAGNTVTDLPFSANRSITGIVAFP